MAGYGGAAVTFGGLWLIVAPISVKMNLFSNLFRERKQRTSEMEERIAREEKMTLTTRSESSSSRKTGRNMLSLVLQRAQAQAQTPSQDGPYSPRWSNMGEMVSLTYHDREKLVGEANKFDVALYKILSLMIRPSSLYSFKHN
ncbi:hypothetical protein LguiA_007650 [Lonicera macranthoides]